MAIYITGDTHGNFNRFTKKHRMRMNVSLTESDYVIIAGDFGFLWLKDKEYTYNIEWMSRLPFIILWVQGNHENYDMIAEFPLEEWNGGKVRHIIRDKIILLERGQVFTIEGKTFFTFGGASSHDIQGGILDPDDMDYYDDLKKAKKSGLPYRILRKSWWPEELPSEEEMQEGHRNLARYNYQVDYVISHCASDRMQLAYEELVFGHRWNKPQITQDILTHYFDDLEDKLQYKHWFCGHYHDDIVVDEKHTILYADIVPLERYDAL